MPHIIREQHVQVDLHASEAEGLALQRRLSVICRDWMMPSIERALDRCAPASGNLYVERLDVDLGTLTSDHLERDFAERVALAIEEQLVVWSETMSLASSSAGSLTNSSVGQWKTEQQSIDEVFLYYVRTGRFPWFYPLDQRADFERVILTAWSEAIRAGNNLRPANEAMRRMLAGVYARQRVTRQFSTHFSAVLLARLAPESVAAVDEVRLALRDSVASPAEVGRVERQMWESAFALVATGGILTVQALARDLWRALGVSREQPHASISALTHRWPEVIDRDRTGATLSAKQAELRSLKAAQAVPTKPEDEALMDQDVAEGVYVDCAGLVLLHPFLPHFFEVLGIVAEDVLVQPDRALCLLHYLATGQHEAPEYALTLPKILCSVPLDMPTQSDIQITAAEQSEAVALLDAVIRHWGALKSTSADGLRGAFILRSGKLSRREDGDWLLQVEASGVDILLEQLPWTLSMIKLPWMDKLLWVEWR